MKKLLILVLVVALVVLARVYTWDRTPPTVHLNLEDGALVGSAAKLVVHLEDAGGGLEEWAVVLSQEGKETVLQEATYPAEEAPREHELEIPISELVASHGLKEEAFTLDVRVRDQPNLYFFARGVETTLHLTLDVTPPQLYVVSGNHYIRQGGSQLILYSTGNQPAHKSGVRVGEDQFDGFLQDPVSNVYAALIGFRYDHPSETPVRAWAEDEAGNLVESKVPHQVLKSKFRKRDLNVSDNFIQKVAAEILSRTSDIQAGSSLAETFVRINDTLRSINHRQIRDLSRKSAPRILFDSAFMQLTNSKVESAFADERQYLYKGEVIDRQTHLGFDLASLAGSPVECANDGRVIWAGYLGIYGQCVLVDHGLGLTSLYAHLSAIEVKAGDKVTKGQSLGLTGETGLAGGDHLHFTTLVQGLPVNPVEWWDAKWVQEQILDRLGAVATEGRSEPAHGPSKTVQ